MSEENRGIEEYRKREQEKQTEFHNRLVEQEERLLKIRQEIRRYTIDVMMQHNPEPDYSEADFYGKE